MEKFLAGVPDNTTVELVLCPDGVSMAWFERKTTQCQMGRITETKLSDADAPRVPTSEHCLRISIVLTLYRIILSVLTNVPLLSLTDTAAEEL